MDEPTRIPNPEEMFELVHILRLAIEDMDASAELKLNETAVLLRRGDIAGSMAAEAEALFVKGHVSGLKVARRKIQRLFGIEEPGEE